MKTLCIHIVDDDAELLDLFRMALQKKAPDFSITTSSSGQECIDYVMSHKVDCILSDYNMFDISGMDLLTNLQRAGYYIPVIFITGQDDERVVQKAFDSGASDYFPKMLGEFAYFARLIHSIRQAINYRSNGSDTGNK